MYFEPSLNMLNFFLIWASFYAYDMLILIILHKVFASEDFMFFEKMYFILSRLKICLSNAYLGISAYAYKLYADKKGVLIK